MQEASRVAQLERILGPERIAPLAGLYDRAVNALDPHSADRAEAERLFHEELRGLYDEAVTALRAQGSDLSVEFRDFKRAVITKCRKYLNPSDRPSSA